VTKFEGLQTLQETGELNTHWVRTEDGDAVETAPWVLSEKYDNLNDSYAIKIRLAIAQPEAHCSNTSSPGSYMCSSKEACLRLPEISPFPGLLSIDDAGVATLVVLVVMLQNNFSTLLHRTIDAYGNIAALYFFGIIVLGTFVLLNYLTALVCNSFASVVHGNGQRDDTMNNSKQSGILFDQIAFQVEAPAAKTRTFNNGDSKLLVDSDTASTTDKQGMLHADKVVPGAKSAPDGQISISKRQEDSKRQTIALLLTKMSDTRVFRGLSAVCSKAYKAVGESLSLRTGALTRVFQRLVIFPNGLEADSRQTISTESSTETHAVSAVAIALEKRWGGGSDRKVAWLELLVGLLTIVHVTFLSNKTTPSMSPEASANLETADVFLLLTFAGIEALRILAFGPLTYLRRGPGPQFDFFITALAMTVWMTGWRSWLQLSSFRLMRLAGWLPSPTAALVALGRPVDIMAAFLCFASVLFVLSMIAQVTLDETYFMSTPAITTTFGLAIGGGKKQLFHDGHTYAGGSAILFVIIGNILLKHICGQIFTAVFLGNFTMTSAGGDSDRVEYQLQFEKLRNLWAWSESKASDEWLNRNRPHVELLHQDGLPSILQPDAAGIFTRISRLDGQSNSDLWRDRSHRFQSCCQSLTRMMGRLFVRGDLSKNVNLKVLALRGRRLNLLESPPVRPNLFLRAYLVGVEETRDMEVRGEGWKDIGVDGLRESEACSNAMESWNPVRELFVRDKCLSAFFFSAAESSACSRFGRPAYIGRGFSTVVALIGCVWRVSNGYMKSGWHRACIRKGCLS